MFACLGRLLPTPDVDDGVSCALEVMEDHQSSPTEGMCSSASQRSDSGLWMVWFTMEHDAHVAYTLYLLKPDRRMREEGEWGTDEAKREASVASMLACWF